MGEAALRKRVIKGAECPREALCLSLRKHLAGPRRVQLANWERATQNLIRLRFRQPAKEIGEKGDLVALREYLVDRKFNAKHFADGSEPLLPLAATSLRPLRVGGSASEFLDLAKPDDTAECQ